MSKIEISIPAGDPLAIKAARMFFDVLDGSRGNKAEITDLSKEIKKQAAINEQAPPPPQEEQVPPPPPPQEEPVPTIKHGVELDRDGVPWDARIHSGNRKIRVKDKRWTPKRGGDPEEYRRITAQLKQAMARGGGEDVPPPPPDEDLPSDFPSFMMWTAKSDPKYQEIAALNELAATVGLDSIAMLAVHPDKIPELVERVRKEMG